MTDDYAEQMRKVAADQAWLDTLSPTEREAEMQRRAELFRQRQAQNQPTEHSLGSKIKFWLGVLAVAAVVVFGIRYCARGTTKVEFLEAGDCIMFPDDGDIGERIDSPDCSEPHDAQVYHEFDAVGVPSDRYESNCLTKADRIDLSLLGVQGEVQAELSFLVYSEERRGRAPIDQHVVCLISFQTPQTGSAVVAE